MWVSRIWFYTDLDSGKLAWYMIYDTMDLVSYFIYITVELLKAYILSVGSLQVMWTTKRGYNRFKRSLHSILSHFPPRPDV